MLCQRCQKRIASVHYTHIINNKKTEMALCEQCANEKGQESFMPSFDLNNFLSGFFGSASTPHLTVAAQKQSVCEKCGMSYSDFQQTGKIGCGNCYRMLGERLKPILKRLHGGVEHNGKVPMKVSKVLKVSRELERLKEMLNKAVQDEEYEKAAEIRDRIKAMEGAKNE